MYKTERLELRLSTQELAILDAVRGSTSRSAWLRNQIHAAHQPGRHLASVAPLPTGYQDPDTYEDTAPGHVHHYTDGACPCGALET